MRNWPALTLLLAACAETGDDTADSGTLPDDTTTDDTITTPTGTVQPGDRVLVVPGSEGLDLYDANGSSRFFATWTDLVGSCAACGGEGASVDDDGGLLVSFTTGAGMSNGAIARIKPDFTLDFRVDGFAFPHDVVRDPSDQTLIVAETSANQLRWIAGDGSSAAAVRTLGALAGFGGMPNGMVRFDHEGEVYVLVTHRGTGGGTPGSVEMWRITDPADVSRVWSFPPSGSLDTPHCPSIRLVGTQWWMTWAHTEGATDGGGSVGLAVTDDPTVAPTYVADLLPSAAEAPFTFLRGVELDEDGTLWIVDSGGQVGGGGSGRLFRAALPELAPTGASGAVDDDQVFATMDDLTLLADGMANPFEGFWHTLP
jgi:hypothetical protein